MLCKVGSYILTTSKINTMQNFTPHNKIVAIKIVGYTNLNLLGKRQSLKIYKTKATCKFAAAKIIVKAKLMAAKKFVDDFANVLRGESLKAKVWVAKKSLRIYKYSWERYIDLCNALRLVRLFNSSVCKDLRVSIY